MESINVSGMHCKSCKMIVEDALQENGFSDIVIDLNEKEQKGIVKFIGDRKKAIEIIKAEGYDAK